MIYSKKQIWDLTAKEACRVFIQKNIEILYHDGSVQRGKVNLIECAANPPCLPVGLTVDNGARSIDIIDENIVEIEVL